MTSTTEERLSFGPHAHHVSVGRERDRLTRGRLRFFERSSGTTQSRDEERRARLESVVPLSREARLEGSLGCHAGDRRSFDPLERRREVDQHLRVRRRAGRQSLERSRGPRQNLARPTTSPCASST